MTGRSSALRPPKTMGQLADQPGVCDDVVRLLIRSRCIVEGNGHV